MMWWMVRRASVAEHQGMYRVTSFPLRRKRGAKLEGAVLRYPRFRLPGRRRPTLARGRRCLGPHPSRTLPFRSKRWVQPDGVTLASGSEDNSNGPPESPRSDPGDPVHRASTPSAPIKGGTETRSSRFFAPRPLPRPQNRQSPSLGPSRAHPLVTPALRLSLPPSLVLSGECLGGGVLSR